MPQSYVDPSVLLTPVDVVTAGVFHVLASLFLILLVRVFLVTIIILLFVGFNSVAKHLPGVPEVSSAANLIIYK